MKIRVLSDLHLEFTKYLPAELPSAGEDLAVLAGDIGIGIQGIEWAKRAIVNRSASYILGNYEFYGFDWDDLIPQARSAAQGSNVHFLENDAIDIGTLRIASCSLWTDFQSMGKRVRDTAATWTQRNLNDYLLIRKQGRAGRLKAQDSAARCQISRQSLEREIESARGSLLVVTHHAPTLRTLNSHYAQIISDFKEFTAPSARVYSRALCPPVIPGRIQFEP